MKRACSIRALFGIYPSGQRVCSFVPYDRGPSHCCLFNPRQNGRDDETSHCGACVSSSSIGRACCLTGGSQLFEGRQTLLLNSSFLRAHKSQTCFSSSCRHLFSRFQKRPAIAAACQLNYMTEHWNRLKQGFLHFHPFPLLEPLQVGMVLMETTGDLINF